MSAAPWGGVLSFVFLAVIVSCEAGLPTDEMPPSRRFDAAETAALAHLIQPPVGRSVLFRPTSATAENRGEFPTPLRLDELAEHQGLLYFLVTSIEQGRALGTVRAPASSEGVPVEVKILADGYPAPDPRVIGSIVLGSTTPTWIAIPLVDLPDADLDVFLRVGGARVITVLRKEPNGLRHLTKRERKGYRYIPDLMVNPATGKALGGTLVERAVHDVIVTRNP